MTQHDTLNIKFSMDDPWYIEYKTFFIIPAFATLACFFIPLFHNEQGLTYLAILPLSTACSYGHTLSPRKPYYEQKWKKLIDYPAYILGSVKRTLLFAIPTGLAGWVSSLFLQGFPKELATLFEISVWGMSSGICLCSFFNYAEELLKFRKNNQCEYSSKLPNLWKWIFPPAAIFSWLAFSKGLLLLNTLSGRS